MPATPGPAKASLPAWMAKRHPGAAIGLVGGDAASVYLLFGQFEHPDEAIVKFDRATGCASEVVGPFPTIAKVVRGRTGFDSPPLAPAAIVALAESPAFRAELAQVVPIYARFANTGESKLAFSLDGKRVIVQATDQRLLASADGGAHFVYLEGDGVDMPSVAADGRFAIVRACTGSRCAEPLKASVHRPAYVDFFSLPKNKPIGGPALQDVVLTRAGRAVVLRSDQYGKPHATRLCLHAYDDPSTGLVRDLACMPTTFAGEWKMMAASPAGTRGAIALVGPGGPNKGAITMSVRSLDDGLERERFEVPGLWEHYQWIDLFVSDRGVVVYRTRGSQTFEDPATFAIRAPGGRTRAERGRPIGFLNERELVVVHPMHQVDPHGCGLVTVLDVTEGTSP